MIWEGIEASVRASCAAADDYARNSADEVPHADYLPESDPLLGQVATPSMRATLKYCWVVWALLVVHRDVGRNA